MQISPETILVRLKDKIMLKVGIDLAILKNLIIMFVNSALKNSTPTKMHYSIVNMTNEFSSNKMTIKCFFKFLTVIKAKKVRFDITVVDANNREITVSEEVTLNINFDAFSSENKK